MGLLTSLKMSKDQEERLTLIINWAVKIIVGIASFLLVAFFMEIKNDVRQMNEDISSIKERLARIEGSLTK